MTKRYIRIRTRTIQPDSWTKTGRSIRQLSPRKPGSLDRVAGASVYILTTSCLILLYNRICPGRHFALRMLYFTIARILATFDIIPPIDDDGRPRIPEVRYNKKVIP